MALTKNDLSAIRTVVKEEVKIQIDPLKKDIKKLDEKFIKLFNFLDREILNIKSKVKDLYIHLRLPLSDL